MSSPRPAWPSVFLMTALLCALALTATVFARRALTDSALLASDAAHTLTVHVVEPAGAFAIENAASLLRRSVSVRSAIPIDAVRAARLLNAYGGPEIDPDSLPAANLIEVRLQPEAYRNAATLELGSLLDEAGYTAEIYDSGAAAHGADRAVAITGVGAAFALAVLCAGVFMTARAAALARPELASLHADLGGARAAALANYGRSAAQLGLLAGLVGTAAYLIASLGVVVATAPGINVGVLLSRLSSWEIVIVLAAPLMTSAVSALGARAGAARVYAAAAKLA